MQSINDARRQLPLKKTELRNAKLRSVEVNAIGLLKGPVTGVTGLALGNESNVTTMRLEDEIKELENIIESSQNKIMRLRSEPQLL